MLQIQLTPDAVTELKSHLEKYPEYDTFRIQIGAFS